MTVWLLRRIDIRDPNAPASFYKPLDGDMKKVRLIDESVDFGRRPIDRTVMWCSGRWVDPTHVPTRLTRTTSHGGTAGTKAAGLPDFDSDVLFAQIVSRAFKDIVEAHDPGKHQFLPVALLGRASTPVAKDYFWLAPGIRTYAMDSERTQPSMRPMQTTEGWVHPRPDRPAHFFSRDSGPIDTWQPVFFGHELGEADLFVDAALAGCMFVTDRLRQALEGAGLIGFGFKGPFQVI